MFDKAFPLLLQSFSGLHAQHQTLRGHFSAFAAQAAESFKAGNPRTPVSGVEVVASQDRDEFDLKYLGRVYRMAFKSLRQEGGRLIGAVSCYAVQNVIGRDNEKHLSRLADFTFDNQGNMLQQKFPTTQGIAGDLQAIYICLTLFDLGLNAENSGDVR